MIEIKDLDASIETLKEPDIHCNVCGEHITGGAEQWPGVDGSPICQMCWESECDDAWWEIFGNVEAVF